MQKLTKITKNIAAMFALLALTLGSFGMSGASVAHAIVAPSWNVSGNYVVNMNYLGTDYSHDLSLTQDGSGNLTGNGGSPAGANVYTYTITSGSVSGDSINLTANYTATADAVTPQTVLNMSGTVANDGSLSGTWSDNYQGGARSGTWSSASGTAASLNASLSAQDFGVMDMSGVKGYTAGFGVNNATLTGATSIVVKLYSGSTLLQTDTASNLGLFSGLTQFSSPFDVFGTFNYPADGYWTNVRGSEYGQNLIPDKVVATVTLANGQVVTAQNTNLTGDTSTIFPVPGNVTTNATTNITSSNATLNGMNNANAAVGHSFWVSTSPFATTSPVIPSGVYSTPDLGAINANTAFSASLSSVSGLPAITPNTTYYVAAWSNVDGTWYPGSVLSFTTADDTIGGTVGGTGVLAVTGVDTIDNTATADGVFADGWKYVFHITVPTDETHIAMKFADWAKTGGNGSIPVANNMRISSSQADNSGATVLLTAANTYSSPTLNMTGDLDPNTDGKQVDVTVEVSVPAGTANGNYTTSYGVNSN